MFERYGYETPIIQLYNAVKCNGILSVWFAIFHISLAMWLCLCCAHMELVTFKQEPSPKIENTATPLMASVSF